MMPGGTVGWIYISGRVIDLSRVLNFIFKLFVPFLSLFVNHIFSHFGQINSD